MWYLKQLLVILLPLSTIRHNSDVHSPEDCITPLPCLWRRSFFLKNSRVLTHFKMQKASKIISRTRWGYLWRRVSILLSSNIVGQEKEWKSLNIMKFTTGIAVIWQKSYQHLLWSTCSLSLVPHEQQVLPLLDILQHKKKFWQASTMKTVWNLSIIHVVLCLPVLIFNHYHPGRAISIL